LPVEGRARYRFSQALCSFALRDEPAFRKPLRVTKPACVAYCYSFYSSFFCAFYFLPLLRWLLFIFISVLLASLFVFLTRLFLCVLTSNVDRAPQRHYWLSGHAKARPDSFTTKFYWRPRGDNFPSPDGDSAKKITRHETWHCMIMRAVSPLLMLKNSIVTRNFITKKIASLFLKTIIS